MAVSLPETGPARGLRVPKESTVDLAGPVALGATLPDWRPVAGYRNGYRIYGRVA